MSKELPTSNQQLCARYIEQCPALDRLESLCLKEFAEWLDEQEQPEIERLRAALNVDPEEDLYSDAMDDAVAAYHSVRHGAMRNAERAGETANGELIVRRALAFGFGAYMRFLRESAPRDETAP